MKQTNSYFDLKKYFKSEIQRLTGHAAILKKVSYNGHTEIKITRIKNWENELAFFTASDINKPSFKDSYRILLNHDSTVYTAIDANLLTRKITVCFNNNQVFKISIINSASNLLYSNHEVLTYLPNLGYMIEKYQNVRFLGGNHYNVSGRFK